MHRNAWLPALALFGGACGTEDDAPPELLEIRLVDVDELRLTFSEILAAPRVDVSAFRLSAAIVRGEVTRYYALEATDADLEAFGDGGVDGGSDGTGDDGTSSAGIVDVDGPVLAGSPRPQGVFDPAIRSVDKPLDLYAQPIDDALAVRLFASLADTPGCARLRDIPSSEGGLVLHYDPPVDGALADSAGNPVAPHSPVWVVRADQAMIEAPGVLPLLGELPPIPCP